MELPNPFHVVMVRHDDGEHLPILLDSNRNPIVWANEFLIKVRRPRLAAKTLRKELFVLGYLHEFCKHAGIDLIQRLYSGIGLTADEITFQLFHWMRRNFGARAGRKVVRLVVQRETVDYRMALVLKLINWHMNSAITRLKVGDLRINHIQAKIEAMHVAFESIVTDIVDHKVTKMGLPSHQVKKLLEICYPGHIQNPWKSCYQERNYLILVLLLTFGIRRGELLKLKLRDLYLHGLIPEIRVQRRPDDHDDHRAEAPQVKTESRALPCDKFLAQRLQHYITTDRKKIPSASKSPFLILARSGQAMSEKRINGIFKQIGKVHPEFSTIHPHLCRHTCNTRLYEAARAKGLSHEEITQHLEFLNGWKTDNSDTYAQAAISKNAQALSLSYQQGLFIQFEDVPF